MPIHIPLKHPINPKIIKAKIAAQEARQNEVPSVIVAASSAVVQATPTERPKKPKSLLGFYNESSH